ncbi:MAG: glucuronate isomerase [Clostridia bacterium]|nr:glucuronate isomerase [Clostridia bacterium]
MKEFMNQDFLLKTETAKILYHHYASQMPIIDYHCHVPPKEIAEDKRYSTITELWLGGDHYKWRAMRSNGIDEKYITGDASDYEKFKAWASTMPKLIGNPLYHWAHLELQRYFGFEGILNEDTCDSVWELCNEILGERRMSARNIIRDSGVTLLCTTDDPIDDLRYHKQLAEDESYEIQVLPAFRPDKGLNVERDGYREYIEALAAAADMPITDIASLKAAYVARLDEFEALGCRTADHGFDEFIPFAPEQYTGQVNEIFKSALAGHKASIEEMKIFKTEMMYFFAEEYTRRAWVMQLHFGVLRNVNPTMFEKLGPDTGFDIIGGGSCISDIARLLGEMRRCDILPRTILYSINPADNAGLDALIGAFQENGHGMPRLQHGSAWWFNDNKTGMRSQLKSLANMSVLGNFVGMLTDSRSFISYPRHEYFRRILCDVIGEWVELGEYPMDIDTLAQMVCDISYNNTKDFFGFEIL